MLRKSAFAAFFIIGSSFIFPQPSPRLLRISLENSADHVQVRMVRRFAERVEARAAGRFRIEVYDSARMFRDADVVPALALGKVEMAVPGTWQLDKYAPDFACLFLPSAFGKSEAEMEKIADGEMGKFLTDELASLYAVRSLGRWFELGNAHTFFVGGKDWASEKLRIRVAGGAAMEARLRILGAFPMTIPWPDLGRYLSQGLVDAVVTTYETLETSKLRSSGITSVSEDNHYTGFYVPLVSRSFWNRLEEADKAALFSAWEKTVEEERSESKASQLRAKTALAAEGLSVVEPTPEEVSAVKGRLQTGERDIAAHLRISSAAFALMRSVLGEASQ